LTFNDTTQFASATKNIILTDTINKTIIKGDYAEIFKAVDSAMITKRSFAIKMVEKDSLFIKADTLFAIGPSSNRLLKGRFNVKIFKQNLSGKSDKIIINQKTGLTKLLRNDLSKLEKQILTTNEIAMKNPILWNGYNQMTGDEIHITRNLKTNELDSLKILNNAFVVEKDTLGINNFNQIKGINLFGKFIENELKTIELIQNTEMIYYLYDDNSKDLIGIDKAVCSSITMEIDNNTIKEITFTTNPEGEVFPEKEMDISLKKLNGFNWRILEKITKKEELFLK
jgi:DNA-binding protein